MENKDLNKCFVITPIGDEDTTTRCAADDLIEKAISPTLKELGYDTCVGHKTSTPGSIDKQMIGHILYDKLAIANLTGLNPNVMYELGIRHSFGLPVVLLAERGTKLPFNISHQHVITYETGIEGFKLLKVKLRKAIEATEGAVEFDNPVTVVADLKLMLEQKMRRENPHRNSFNYLIRVYGCDVFINQFVRRLKSYHGVVEVTGPTTDSQTAIKIDPTRDLLSHEIRIKSTELVSTINIKTDAHSCHLRFEGVEPLNLPNQL